MPEFAAASPRLASPGLALPRHPIPHPISSIIYLMLRPDHVGIAGETVTSERSLELTLLHASQQLCSMNSATVVGNNSWLEQLPTRNVMVMTMLS